jgi:nucleoside-diphosphate-sugar epimerase
VVFGGTGFIGSHLVDHFSRCGAAVTVADIEEPRRTLPSNATFERCDVRDPLQIRPRPEADLVVNAAAVHRTPGHPDSEYYDTNIGGAVNVVNWCRDVGVPTICFTSSISVYGPGEDSKDESSPLAPVSAYGKSKVLAEHVHRMWLDSAGSEARLVVVRPAVVFGTGERGNFTRLAAALSARRFVYPGRTDVVKACGYVGDLVRAVAFGLDSGEREVTFNYCYPTRYTLQDVCEAFNEVAGYPTPPRAPQLGVAGVLALADAMERSGRGIKTAARVKKLLHSTDIRPAVLSARGFVWETDLVSGLRRWREESPTGRFE